MCTVLAISQIYKPPQVVSIREYHPLLIAHLPTPPRNPTSPILEAKTSMQIIVDMKMTDGEFL